VDKIDLRKNLEFVRPETKWKIVDSFHAKNCGAAIDPDSGLCLVMGGKIFGSSHIAVHEILHAKGRPKKEALESILNSFHYKNSERFGAMLWLLEELRVERLVKEKGYSSPPERFKKAGNLISAAISAIWSLEVPAPFLFKRQAGRLARLIFSYEKMPVAPAEVAAWLKDALPKAMNVILPTWQERIVRQILNWWHRLKSKLLQLWEWLINKNEEKKTDSGEFMLPDPADCMSDPASKKELAEKEFEQAKHRLESKKEKNAFSSPAIDQISKIISSPNPYQDVTLILPPAHAPCPPDTNTMLIPAYITNALLTGLQNKKTRYARSGRKLLIPRLIASAPPFAKSVRRSQKILILLDFSGSMQEWLAPMLETVAKLAASTDFDVLAYSADSKRFLLHLIYSDKYFSHAVHYNVGNADCAAFYLARRLQVNYDKVLIIGDMVFWGPAPCADQLYSFSTKELNALLKEKRAIILLPEYKKQDIKNLAGHLQIQNLELCSYGFDSATALKEILEAAIRAA